MKGVDYCIEGLAKMCHKSREHFLSTEMFQILNHECAIVHGVVVGELSPVKTSSKKNTSMNYFAI